MLITRQIEFSASHRCGLSSASPEENRALYGEEANPRGHGHNFRLLVTVRGEPHPESGMVLDLKDLKRILQEQVGDPMDHRYLNCEVPPFDRVVPTIENIAIEIWRRLEARLPGLHRVRLYQSDDLYVDYYGDAE